MFTSLADAYRRALAALVRASGRAAGWVVVVAALATAGLLYYTVTHLSLNTNTVDMLDPSLPFRRLQAELNRTFPQLDDLIVVVVEAGSADRAADATDALAAELSRRGRHIESVYQPGRGPFFERNGLLYLDPEVLADLADRLAAAAPFLTTLASDPTLSGLFSLLGRAIGEDLGEETAELLRTSLDEIATAVEAVATQRPYHLSWVQEMLSDESGAAASHQAFILARPRLSYATLKPGAAALAEVREAVQNLQLVERFGARVRLTGEVAMDAEELKTVSQEAGIATALSFALIWVILLLGLRSLRLALSILLTLFVGLVWTAALATFTVGELNLISVTFAVLFVGLAVDFGIQLGMRYREELGYLGDHTRALTASARGAGGALTLAAAAAVVSFFSFIPTAYRGLGQLGFIAGTSMVIALFLTLALLPALLTLIPVRTIGGIPEHGVLTRSEFSIYRHRRAVLTLTALLVLSAALLLPRVRFDFNPLNLKDPKTESVATFLDLVKDPTTTPYTITVLAPDLETARQLAARLATLEVVDKAVTLASYMPKHQEDKLAMIADMGLMLAPVFLSAEASVTPDTAEQVAAIERFREQLSSLAATADTPELRASAQHLASALGRLTTLPGWPSRVLPELKDRLLAGLPEQLAKLRESLQADSVELADLPSDLKARYIAPDGRARIEVFPSEDVRDNRALRRFVAAVQAVAPQATGGPVTLVEAGAIVVRASVQAVVTALVAALALLTLALRSLVGALLILLPLLLALLFTAATSVLLDLPFNFANVIALPLLLGVGIAFGIYLVMRRRSGLDITRLFRSSTPRAVLFSGLTTIAAFGTLAISQHPGTSSMGMLISLALAYALLGTLVVLPAVMSDRADVDS